MVVPMLTNILYIIGNGFDLNHRLPTGYGHFKAYVRIHDRDVHDWIEDYVPAGESWGIWKWLSPTWTPNTSSAALNI